MPRFEIATEVPSTSEIVGLLVGEGPAPLTKGSTSGENERRRGFSGSLGEVFVRQAGTASEMLVGAGEVHSLDAAQMRRAAASFARSVAKEADASFDLRGVEVPDLPVGSLVQAVVEGVAGATYRFDRYRSTTEPATLEVVRIVVDEADQDAAVAGLARGEVISQAVCFARDLSNYTARELTPSMLGDKAAEIAEAAGLRAEIFDEEQARAQGLGGLLGVAAGSEEPPRLIKLTYDPDPKVARNEGDRIPTVALVGKGITFDSGGLSLKTADGMIGMKMDMSGAAAVIAAASACRALAVPVRVVAIAPVTENMPGRKAIKPGDVLHTRNGKTIEVLNTDAEGRLVLADGLALAVDEEPDAIVDVATLTGACVVALGGWVAGLMGNDSSVVGQVASAADRAGEPVWRLPLPRAYRKHIESPIADMKNMGKARQAGALIAGLILEEFVSDRPWAHLDIAGPADSDEELFEYRKGATGFGVRTLIEFVESFRPSGRSTADHQEVGW
jgi:leucyl aminopeptidase